jgi:hypothetical protein
MPVDMAGKEKELPPLFQLEEWRQYPYHAILLALLSQFAIRT